MLAEIVDESITTFAEYLSRYDYCVGFEMPVNVRDLIIIPVGDNCVVNLYPVMLWCIFSVKVATKKHITLPEN